VASLTARYRDLEGAHYSKRQILRSTFIYNRVLLIILKCCISTAANKDCGGWLVGMGRGVGFLINLSGRRE